MPPGAAPRQVLFDATPEIFATDAGGSFVFPLSSGGETWLDTAPFDEIRFMISAWYPSGKSTMDLDRCYLEIRLTPNPNDDHWVKLAEIEPVVPAYDAGDRFDGWLVLPILARRSLFTLAGSGFHPRTRIQLRASAYLVS